MKDKDPYQTKYKNTLFESRDQYQWISITNIVPHTLLGRVRVLSWTPADCPGCGWNILKHFEILSFVAVLKFMVFMVVFILCFRLNKNQFPESVKKVENWWEKAKMDLLEWIQLSIYQYGTVSFRKPYSSMIKCPLMSPINHLTVQ